MIDAVAGGGVPVGAYQNRASGVAVHPDAGNAPRLAPWAFDTPYVPPHTDCQGTTKKGERCNAPRVPDPETGALTTLCVGHWNGVLAYKKKLDKEAAGGS